MEDQREREISVAAVVVTFNRKKLLLECLEALKNQTYPLTAIFIIDGPSTDGTPQALLDNGYIQELPPENYSDYSWDTENTVLSIKETNIKIKYVRLYEDVGGAGGFYEGVKRAYEGGYDWIWLMDDDAEPRMDALENLIKYVDLPQVVGLVPLQESPDGKLGGIRGFLWKGGFIKYTPVKWTEKQYVPVEISSFVGPLIKRSAVEKIGFPEKKFFIRNDDIEYTYRLSRVGNLYMIPSSIILHKEIFKAEYKGSVFGKKYYTYPFNKFWRQYYTYRNWVYLDVEYSKTIVLIRDLILQTLKQFGGILLFDDHKFGRLFIVFSAYLDGLRNRFDNDKPKRIYHKFSKK